MKSIAGIWITLFGLSMMAMAQSSQNPGPQLYPVLNPSGISPAWISRGDRDISWNFSEVKSGQPGYLRMPFSDSVFRIKSINHWKLDAGWKLFTRDTDMVYDANNHLTGYTTQLRSGNTWEKHEQYTAAYDGNNRLTSELHQIWRDAVTLENDIQRLAIYAASPNSKQEILQYWSNGV